MANDFDGQIDYLEQFGTNSVSNFLHLSSNCWNVVAGPEYFSFLCVCVCFFYSLKSLH